MTSLTDGSHRESLAGWVWVAGALMVCCVLLEVGLGLLLVILDRHVWLDDRLEVFFLLCSRIYIIAT